MAFRSAPKAFQSLENTHRKRSVSLFLKSLEFYASSIELSEDGKNGKNGKILWGNPKPKWAKNGLFGRDISADFHFFFFEKYKGTTPPGWSHPGDIHMYAQE